MKDNTHSFADIFINIVYLEDTKIDVQILKNDFDFT